MKLYYSPAACSIGIHILLEEIGKPYETHRVSFPAQEQYGPAFTAINPKSKVPTLVRDDGSVLTEFPAIAVWLARTNPEKHLFPEDLEGQTRVLEAIDYIVATVHMQGFSRQFRPANFSPNDADHDAVKARGREIVTKAFGLLDAALGSKPFLFETFSIADTALFYVESWAGRVNLPLPGNLARHFATMLARPSVKKVFETEGLPLPG